MKSTGSTRMHRYGQVEWGIQFNIIINVKTGQPTFAWKWSENGPSMSLHAEPSL